MAENRVLNYSEFAGKYSQEAQQDMAASYSEFSKASDNFQEGFDEDTYEEGQSGPKRPLNIGSDETPVQPGEDGAPEFSTEHEGMESPSDEHEEHEEDFSNWSDEDDDDDDDSEEFEGPQPDLSASAAGMDDEGGNPEGEEEEDEDDEDDEEEDEDDEEEEDEEETNESFKSITLLESFDEFSANSQPRSSYASMLDIPELDGEEEEFEYDMPIAFGDDHDDDYEDDHDEYPCMVRCKSCGAEKSIPAGEYPMSQSNVDNPDSWWQGASLGMQCGCNP